MSRKNKKNLFIYISIVNVKYIIYFNRKKAISEKLKKLKILKI